jgi:hypothetical protein
MGGEHMGVVLELYTLAVDATGIYMINDGGQAWRTGRIDADTDVFAELELLAYEYEPGLALPIIHGTSNRQDGPHMVHTFVAVAETAPFVQFVLARWAPPRSARRSRTRRTPGLTPGTPTCSCTPSGTCGSSAIPTTGPARTCRCTCGGT